MVLQPVEILKSEIPFEEESVFISEGVKAGLVLVDIINGFCTVGSGNLVRENSKLSAVERKLYNSILVLALDLI